MSPAKTSRKVGKKSARKSILTDGELAAMLDDDAETVPLFTTAGAVSVTVTVLMCHAVSMFEVVIGGAPSTRTSSSLGGLSWLPALSTL